jgi:hypothetical protein
MRVPHANSFLIGGGVSDGFKKAYNMGTRDYDFVKDKQEDLRQGFDVAKRLLGKGMVSGTRLFGENARLGRSTNYFQ